MTAATHAVLIRGINVGGKNPVPMAALRAALEDAGYQGVRTYIQSGNVLLAAPGSGTSGDSKPAGSDSSATPSRAQDEAVAAAVEAVLADDFGVDTVVVAVGADALRRTVADAPDGFGSKPDTYHYDVCFLHPSVATDDAVAVFKLRDGVDSLWAGDAALYFRRLSAQRTKSRMNSVMASPVYKHMTIRNWRTTTTLVAMLDQD